MQSQDLKNSILLICLDTESETLLFPNHPSRVEFGWNYMLEKLEIDSIHLTAQQIAMILDARSIINQFKILDDPSENLKEFNKKFKQTLVSFPQDPKGLIRESLRVINQDNPELILEFADESKSPIEIIEKVATRQIHILNRLKTLADVLDYESQKLTLAFDRKVLNEALSRDNLSRDSFSEIFEKQYLDSLTESVLRCRNQNSSFSSSFRSKCLSRVIRIQPNFDLPSSFRLTFTESGDFLMEFKHVTFRDNLDIDLLQVVLN
jgi:hypothetical protein